MKDLTPQKFNNRIILFIFAVLGLAIFVSTLFASEATQTQSNETASLEGVGLLTSSSTQELEVAQLFNIETEVAQLTGPDAIADCDPNNAFVDYCSDDRNLLDNASFENPICTENPDGSITGDACAALGNFPTFYQQDTSILIPRNSEVYYTEGPTNFDKPEVIVSLKAGKKQCEEQLTAHGDNYLKMFSRGGKSMDAGICFNLEGGTTLPAGTRVRVGASYRATQAALPREPGNAKNVDVRIGYSSKEANPAAPSISKGEVFIVDEKTLLVEEFEAGYDGRYTGGSLSAEFSVFSGMRSFCLHVESEDNAQGIDVFWDGMYVTTDALDSGDNCDVATDHSDGIDRTCGGYDCSVEKPLGFGAKGNEEDFYGFDTPSHWDARQCEFNVETNGAESQSGTLFFGIDLNSCDPDIEDKSQLNVNPEFQNCQDPEDQPIAAPPRYWTAGYVWTGCVKDVALLNYLNCSVTNTDDGDINGTEDNPFFCPKSLSIAQNNTKPSLDINVEDEIYLRLLNSYPGLLIARQAEGTRRNIRVPLLGSAVGAGAIDFESTVAGEFLIDPFLVGYRHNSSSTGSNYVVDFTDAEVSALLNYESLSFKESTISEFEILPEGLLATGPVCQGLYGGPITRFNLSDRSEFGFADDEGTCEQFFDAGNLVISPEDLCDSNFVGRHTKGEVVGSECTINGFKFTEDNIGDKVTEEFSPTLPPPAPPGIPDTSLPPTICPERTICGEVFDCDDTIREVYDACRDLPGTDGNIDKVGGNPFIRWERPEGWRSLEIPGLNKTLENSWKKEHFRAPFPIRHENVGIDLNYVVSGYDQQQPKCSFVSKSLGSDKLPPYCTGDSATDKKNQVCRRVPAYDTQAEDGFVPISGASSVSSLELEELSEQIANAPYHRYKNFISLLEEPAEYENNYDGQYRLANTAGEGESECTSETTNHTGVSQARIEAYYPYVGQVARMNERLSVILSNANDGDTSANFINADLDDDEIDRYGYTLNNPSLEVIELPFCDELRDNEAKRTKCEQEGESCDCYLRTCEEARDMKKKKALRVSGFYECEVLRNPSSVEACKEFAKDAAKPAADKANRDYDECVLLEKTPDNYNCDPMADYLLGLGFDDPILEQQSCDYDYDQVCEYEKFGVHLINGPTQQDKYDRMKKIGLKWKLEVTTKSFENEPIQTIAIADGINKFEGTSVVRFCNGDKDIAGNDIPDRNCDFSIHFTGDSYASGQMAANTYIEAAKLTSKIFVASPVNEPISEEWAGQGIDEVITFYEGLFDKLESEPDIRSRILVASPTWNVTANGNYNHFDDWAVQFMNSDVGDKIDLHSVNVYNGSDIGLSDNIEGQMDHVLATLSDGKPVGINEMGSFDVAGSDPGLDLLKDSLDYIAGTDRISYALFFNGMGGASSTQNTSGVLWSDLELTDDEYKDLLKNSGVCYGANTCNAGLSSGSGSGTGTNPFNCFGTGVNDFQSSLICAANTIDNDIDAGKSFAQLIDEYGPYCDTETFQLKSGEAKPLPFGFNFAVFYDSIIPVGATNGGRNCSTTPPPAKVYYDPSDVGMACPNFATRSTFPQYSFYRGALESSGGGCGLSSTNMKWNDNTSLGRDPDDLAEYLHSTVNYHGFALSDSPLAEVKAVTQAAKDRNMNPIILLGFWATESWFGQNGATGGSGNSNAQCSSTGPGGNPGGYSGTCEQIFEQVKQEPGYTSLSAARLEINAPGDPLGINGFSFPVCSMSAFTSANPVLHCNGQMTDQCQNCPVRATALFRHELNHAVKPGGFDYMRREFMADAVSNNGGWYMFKMKNRTNFMFATEIVTEFANSSGIDEQSIRNYFNGIGSNPGIDINDLVVDYCHYSGTGLTSACPFQKIPPGLERANCTNLGGGGSPLPPGNAVGEVIGTSFDGHDIKNYKFGDGPNEVVFVGGMHGGYEWASILLAYEMIDYFDANPTEVPEHITLHIIPAVNVDGQELVTGSAERFTPPSSSRRDNYYGRFNGRGVDLNRNWGCNWEPVAYGPLKPGADSDDQARGFSEVDPGSSAFSEPENQALRSFFLNLKNGSNLRAVVFWHNVAGITFPAGCGPDLYPPSVTLSELYGAYPVDYSTSGFLYPITGDASNWLETIDIPATTAELNWPDNQTEFSRNLAGVKRVIEFYNNPVNPGPF